MQLLKCVSTLAWYWAACFLLLKDTHIAVLQCTCSGSPAAGHPGLGAHWKTIRPYQHNLRKLWWRQALAMLPAPLAIHCIPQQLVDVSLHSQ